MSEIGRFIVPIITGAANGMLIYLAAAGMSLILSGMGTINFSQGAFYLLGSLICYSVTRVLPFGVGLLVAIVVTFLLGFIVELALRPTINKPLMHSVVVTLALTYIVGNLMETIWGSVVKINKIPEALSATLTIGGVVLPAYYLFIIVIAALIALAFWIMFYKTKIGMNFRAIISDRAMTESLGVNVNLMYSLMFMFGIALAGIAGALNSPLSGIEATGSMTLFAQVMPVLIIGGLSNLKGALPAALLLGVVQALAALFIPQYYNLVPSVLMVLIMFIKPEGLFTKKGTAKTL